MNFFRMGLATAGLIAATGCTDVVVADDSGGETGMGCDTMDSAGCDTGDPALTEITNISPTGCTGTGAAGDTWGFQFEASGDAVVVEMSWTEPGSANPWSEEGHTTDTALALNLTAVATPAEVTLATAGTGTTLFNCNWDDGATLAYKADLIDSSGGSADCAVWGYMAEATYPGCVCFDCGE